VGIFRTLLCIYFKDYYTFIFINEAPSLQISQGDIRNSSASSKVFKKKKVFFFLAQVLQHQGENCRNVITPKPARGRKDI